MDARQQYENLVKSILEGRIITFGIHETEEGKTEVLEFEVEGADGGNNIVYFNGFTLTREAKGEVVKINSSLIAE